MKISVVIPVYNEEKLINACLEALINQNYPKENYEVVVVNDGSTDDTEKQITNYKLQITEPEIKLINLEKNLGRAKAREAGAKAATYENLLFIDSRCVADRNILQKIKEINYEPIVGNPLIDFNRSVFDRFNWLMRKKLYRNSFGEHFAPVYITTDNFDKVAKGTTVFFCNRELFLSSQPEDKGKNISDDIKLIWNIVQEKKILKHPAVKVFYQARTTFKDTVKHTFNRGPKFVDYYLNPAKKYFWLFIFAPIFILGMAIFFVTIKPILAFVWIGFLAVLLLSFAFWLSENIRDFFISVAFLPVFAVSFESGIIAGLVFKLRRFFTGNAIVFIFFLAVISGFFWNWPMFGQPASSDQGFYDRVAQNILAGNGFTNQGKDAGIEPLYPLFLAGIYKIFGHDYNAVRIIQIILFALTAVFVYILAKKIFNGKIAAWSAIIIALFYGLANQAGSLTTETLFIFLLILFVWVIYKSLYKDNLKWLAVAGAILGLAALTRSIIQYFFILAAINLFILYYKKIPFNKVILKVGIFLVSFFIVLTPWLMRERLMGASGAAVAPRIGGGLASRVERMERIYPNYAGHFIGRLFGYYFSEKLGFDAKYEDYRHVTGTDKYLNELIKAGKSENEIDKILSAEAKEKIFKEPHKFITVSFLDFISFNSPILFQKENWQNTLEIHPMFAEGRHPEIPDWQKTAIILGIRSVWFLFFGLIIYALIKNFRDWRRIGWIFLIILYFNLAYSAIHAIPRYALPIYPFYVILAVAGAFHVYNRYAKKQP